MTLRRLLQARRFHLSCALVLLATLLTPFSPAGTGWAPAAVVASGLAQDTGSAIATLEARQPEVQWSPTGAATWQTVATQQTVSAGDRVRTGAGAAARLVYFEGTVTEISADTGLLVQRLERSPDGNIISHLFQSAGTTVSRVVHLVDPAAAFEIETSAATAFVRGTTPQVTVASDGRSRVSNQPSPDGGTVDVQGKDANATVVTLQQGEETSITPGQPPSTPSAIGSQQQQQQQQEQQQQQMMQQQAMMMAAQQGAAASFAAQAGMANAIANQALMNQLLSTPNFPFSSFPVATALLR